MRRGFTPSGRSLRSLVGSVLDPASPAFTLLEVMVAIFEDLNFNPALAAHADQWQQAYGLSFPVVADTDNVLSTYYDKGAAPLNMLVDLCTMEVLYSSIGFDETAVTALIESNLAASE